MKYSLLITGASGFIGTSLIQYYMIQGFNVLNIDINPPQDSNHLNVWKKIDITDRDNLSSTITTFNPHFIIHLAARTDLNGSSMEDYAANTIGVENMLAAANKCSNLKRVLIASSMLVCKSGYQPKSEVDYKPDTIYGESKVQTEVITRNFGIKSDWAILRPTSIWGPWFKEPYRNFFDMVIGGKYFHIGHKSCTKTYGYIGNAIYQIDSILNADATDIQGKVFYIGDYEPYQIEKWGDEIADQLGRKIRRMPFIFIQIAAIAGDILKALKIAFPMSSFRLKNMTTDNIIDLSHTQKIAPNLPFSRVAGIKETLKWLGIRSANK